METFGLRELACHNLLLDFRIWETNVGTRIDTPVTLPLRSGKTLATAFAAPVVVGIMLLNTPRPVSISELVLEIHPLPGHHT